MSGEARGMQAHHGKLSLHFADERLVGQIGIGQCDDHVVGAGQRCLAQGDRFADIAVFQAKPIAGA